MSTTFENQALAESLALHGKYIADHVTASLTTEQLMKLGCARYQFMLEVARERLSFQFSVGDVLALADSYRGYIFVPNRFAQMGSDLCDNLGVSYEHYQSSECKALVDKLDRLDLVLKMALADALEQFWRNGQGNSEAVVKRFFLNLGIRLL